MTDPDSLLLELRAKNGHLLRAILEREPSIAAFCRTHDLAYPTVCSYINLRESPYLNREQGLRKAARRILEATGENMIWLFDPDLYDNNIIPNETLIAFAAPAQMVGLDAAAAMPALGPAPDEAMDIGALERLIRGTVATLTPREEDIIRRRYALDPYDQEQTYDAIGEAQGVTRERIRQIEGKALRKLRGPVRSRALKRALQGDITTPEQAMTDRTDELLWTSEATAIVNRKRQRRRFAEAQDASAERHRRWLEDRRTDEPPELEIDDEARELGIDDSYESPEDRYIRERETALEDWQPGPIEAMSTKDFRRQYRPATEVTTRSGIMTKRQLLDELTRRRVCREAGIDPELPPEEIDAELRRRAVAEAAKQKEKP